MIAVQMGQQQVGDVLRLIAGGLQRARQMAEAVATAVAVAGVHQHQPAR